MIAKEVHGIVRDLRLHVGTITRDEGDDPRLPQLLDLAVDFESLVVGCFGHVGPLSGKCE